MIDLVLALAFGSLLGSLLGIAVVRGDDWIQRGHGHGGTTTPKPPIIPNPQFPPSRAIPGETL